MKALRHTRAPVRVLYRRVPSNLKANSLCHQRPKEDKEEIDNCGETTLSLAYRTDDLRTTTTDFAMSSHAPETKIGNPALK
ncbi:hypothetical protein PoB_002496700 [Plakobranchus ocellatus]|uniref:Uncharacterized protein n=1 Tax=Plakobranchus ocellatus TaxID=259542 RepID=A0AAV3ZTL2_9GAST|nr:hypothetical protein PoB_002496700 [Plakobranchus ocellatus]